MCSGTRLYEELIARMFAPAGASEFESAKTSQITASPRGRNHSDGNLTRGSRDEVDGSAFADLIYLREDGRDRLLIADRSRVP